MLINLVLLLVDKLLFSRHVSQVFMPQDDLPIIHEHVIKKARQHVCRVSGLPLLKCPIGDLAFADNDLPEVVHEIEEFWHFDT